MNYIFISKPMYAILKPYNLSIYLKYILGTFDVFFQTAKSYDQMLTFKVSFIFRN